MEKKSKAINIYILHKRALLRLRKVGIEEWEDEYMKKSESKYTQETKSEFFPTKWKSEKFVYTIKNTESNDISTIPDCWYAMIDVAIKSTVVNAYNCQGPEYKKYSTNKKGSHKYGKWRNRILSAILQHFSDSLVCFFQMKKISGDKYTQIEENRKYYMSEEWEVRISIEDHCTSKIGKHSKCKVGVPSSISEKWNMKVFHWIYTTGIENYPW